MKAINFLLASISLFLLQLCVSQKEHKQIRRRLGTAGIGEECENACDCKGYPEEKVCCERRGGDEKKKCYPCEKGGICKKPGESCYENGHCCTKQCEDGKCKKIDLCVIGEKSFTLEPANEDGHVVLSVKVTKKAPLRFVKIFIEGKNFKKIPRNVEIWGKCDGDADFTHRVNFLIIKWGENEDKTGFFGVLHITSEDGEVVDFDEYQFKFIRPGEKLEPQTGTITLYGKCNELTDLPPK